MASRRLLQTSLRMLRRRPLLTPALPSSSSYATSLLRAGLRNAPSVTQPLWTVGPAHTAVATPHRQLRWKRSTASMGHLRDTLDEMAHRPSREAAAERRQKKKERKAAKKGKRGKQQPAEADQEPGGVDTAGFGSEPSADDVDDDELYSGIDDDDDDQGDADADADEQEVVLPDTDAIKDKMMKLVAKFEESLKAVRSGEPTPELFDGIQVNAYGSTTPLKAVGQVVVVSPTMVEITCFDPTVAKEVQKAIQLSMNLNPQLNEGGVVKVPMPRVSMETRQQTVKQVQKRSEGCKQRIRRVRHNVMDTIKKGKEGKLAGISKDDAFAVAKRLDSVTEDAMNSVKEIVAAKSDAIMGA